MQLRPEMFRFDDYFQQYGYNPDRKFVLFYGNRGQDVFGNFWQSHRTFVYNGVTSNNVEAVYQSAKFNKMDRVKFNNISPMAAFMLSRKWKNRVKNNWHNIKEDVMLHLLRQKFSNPLYRLILLSTGSRYLVEHNPVKGRDAYWSDDHDGSGQNRLGHLLMKVRKEMLGVGVVKRPADYDEYVANLP